MYLSVIICSHNPKPHFLKQALRGLQQQSLSHQQWELLVIDNASTEPLHDHFDFTWHPEHRIVVEPTLGLTPARLRGIREAHGNLLVFVDDDNVLDPDYLETAIAISQAHELVGAWSGQCVPAFEEEPAEWTRRYWGMLVIRHFDTDRWSNLSGLPDTMPCGAGLCVRREVAQHYLQLHLTGKRPVVLDRAGKSLMSAGDNDLSACACDIGMGVGLFYRLKLTHLMSPERFEEDYLVRLAEGIHYSSVFFRALREPVPVAPSWNRRLARSILSMRLSRVDRRIHNAVARAERRAIQDLNANQLRNASNTARA